MSAKKDMTEAERDAHHAERMGKRKAARDRMLATKTQEKGLLMVHTGKGKGKSTAAFGLAVRAMGNDMRVGVVQFVKGKWQTGERAILEHFPDNSRNVTGFACFHLAQRGGEFCHRKCWRAVLSSCLWPGNFRDSLTATHVQVPVE